MSAGKRIVLWLVAVCVTAIVVARLFLVTAANVASAQPPSKDAPGGAPSATVPKFSKISGTIQFLPSKDVPEGNPSATPSPRGADSEGAPKEGSTDTGGSTADRSPQPGETNAFRPPLTRSQPLQTKASLAGQPESAASGDPREDILEISFGLPPMTGAPPATDITIGFDTGMTGASPATPIEAAVKRLREAKSDAEKQQAKTALRQVLASVFDEDMQNRERQAKEIEARLGKLRRQYGARQKVKDEIVDLQLKVLEQDAAGLGFPMLPQRATAPVVPMLPGLPGTSGVGDPYLVPTYPRTQHDAPMGETQSSDRSAKPGENRYDSPSASGRPLSEVKKTNAAEVAESMKREHFAESADGKLPADAMSPASHPNIIADYTLLRGRYASTKAELKLIEEQFNALVADAQRQKPNTSIEDVKKQHPREWRMVETAREAWKEVQRLYQAKLRLLEIDLMMAATAQMAAQEMYVEKKQRYELKLVPQSPVLEQAAKLETAKLERQRAETIHDLFKSIEEGAPAAPKSTKAPATNAPAKP